MRRLYQQAYGDAYPGEVEPFGSCTWWTLGQSVAALRMSPGSTLVDLGCGRGGPGLWLARALGARLIGIDFSPVARQQATDRITHFLPADRAEFRSGTFEHSGLPEASADGLVSIDALQFTPNIPAALRELFRILRPGARAVLTASELLHPDPAWPRATTDWRPWVQDAGLLLEQRRVDDGNAERWLALYRLVEQHEAALRSELGDYAADSLVEEARLVTPQLPRRRAVLLALRRPSTPV